MSLQNHLRYVDDPRETAHSTIEKKSVPKVFFMGGVLPLCINQKKKNNLMRMVHM